MCSKREEITTYQKTYAQKDTKWNGCYSKTPQKRATNVAHYYSQPNDMNSQTSGPELLPALGRQLVSLWMNLSPRHHGRRVSLLHALVTLTVCYNSMAFRKPFLVNSQPLALASLDEQVLPVGTLMHYQV